MLPPLRGYPFDPGARSPRAPNQSDRIRMLRGVSLFSDLSNRNLTRIDKISRLGHASAGQVLVTEGDPDHDLMMVVLDGQASVRKGDVEIAVCGPGQCFGEMSLLDDQPRSATVVAVEPTKVLAISRADFRKLLPKAPRLAETLLATMSMRLRAAQAPLPDGARV